MANLNDTYTLNMALTVLKNDKDDLYEFSQTYHNLDYIKLVQIEQVAVEAIAKTIKFGQKAAIALGAESNLFKD